MNITARERFERAYVPEPNTGCWLWLKSTTRKGYGKFRGAGVGIKGRLVSAHRWAYEEFVGPIPPGLFACHKCDVSCCVNPAHIFPGTAAENNADARAKGRAVYLSGPEASNAKFSAADVLAIRARSAAGESRTVLAAEFGVCKGAITEVTNRRTYRDI